MAADQVQFQQILNSLLSTDNDVRQQAEDAYNNLPRDVKVTHLLGTIHNGQQSEEARQMAAVLLRRLFTSEFTEFYKELPQESQAQLLQQILLAVQQEVTPNLRRKICELVAEVARSLTDEDGNNQWTDILQFLFQCANSPSAQLQESALRIFASVPSIFGNQEAQYLDLIKQMLAKSLEPTADVEVRFQAVRAIGAFILHHDKDGESSVFKHFSDLLPRMIMITAESIEAQDDQSLLKLLIDMTETCPKFLRPQLENIFEMCMKVFATTDVEDSWRHLVLEVMVSLSENAPAMVRKRAEKYIVTLIPLVLQMMTDLDEDEEWATSDVVTDDDNSDNNVIAESSLDRLACGLGGKTVLPHVMNALPNMLGHSDWKQRYAALMAISAIGEGCHKQMEAMLEQIMAGVLNFLRDPHPRVRYAACNAIGQMSTDFAPTFEKKFHEQVVPGLLSLLDDVQNPRVQAHAGAALVNFSEDCPKHILTRYLNGIMSKLENILNSKFKELVEKGNKLVLEQVVTTIASVADTCEKEFVTYYDRLMPCLKFIIQNAKSEDLRMLRGKTIECVSLIGLAVGREKFITDAGEVMDMLLKTHTEGDLPDDDPQTSYLITAWARMCKILGKQFEQYLPLVMGPVMHTAAMKPEVALLDNDEVEDIEGDVDWSFINLGEQQNFAIRTAGMEEKASACEMLVCYARELKDGFADYAEEVVRLMVPMLKFYFHDGVRTAAAESLPYLLDCAKIKGPQYLEGMWLYICPELLKVIGTEPEADVQSELLNSLAKCIETLGPNCLNDEAMNQVLDIISKYMGEHFERADKRLQARTEEDYDDGVEEELAEQDDTDTYILSKVVDISHALFLTNKAQFLPYFDRIAPHFIKLLEPNRSWSDRQWGVCAFDDVIEFCGPACAAYQQIFTPPLLQYVTDKSAEVRQAAAYGCGVLGQFGGEHFAVTCAQIIPLLVQVISDAKSREPENVNPTENAIAAVAKILKYNSSAIQNVDEIINLWFSWLPVTEDADEAPHIYGYMCDLIQANHPIILGNNNSNLPRIVSIIAQAFVTKVVAPLNDVGTRMLGIVKQVESNPDVFQACASILTPEQQYALQDAYRELASGAVPATA
ncbi:importin-5 isoform X2 [Rhagoletis pomonella]|uniref:importin-5 isoform X1 n=1 Tax=Rhagoletis pomonella TaxID=28610 RepID=UPI001786B77E|nr:importin-5 isoform X1 [Rhagoletis pomonella]XP_036330359.1 importin-5 isoform X2 [Rhagoletis pomonella]